MSKISIRDLDFVTPPAECVDLALQLRPDIGRQLTHDRMQVANDTAYLWGAAYSENTMVGLLGYCRVDSIADGATLYIHDLIVKETSRNNGIGTSLLQFAKKKARHMGCENVQLDAGFQRADAHRFYESNGFKKSGYFFEIALLQKNT